MDNTAMLFGVKEQLDKQGLCLNIIRPNGFDAGHPRLLNEIPRGTRRYNTIERCRSASERSNSTIKETLNILEKPIVYKKKRADILAQIAAITLLL